MHVQIDKMTGMTYFPNCFPFIVNVLLFKIYEHNQTFIVVENTILRREEEQTKREIE
jgi:hypothetical protein